MPVSTSEYASLSRTLAVSCTWRGKSLPPKLWLRLLRRGRWTTLRSTAMLDPSMAGRFVEEWLASSADFLAPTCPSPASAKESAKETRAVFGSSTRGLFARFSRDGCLLRTSPQFSLFQQEELYSENLPDWVSMRSGELYELPTWAPPTSASGDSFWPTARALSGGPESQERKHELGRMASGTEDLQSAAEHWPTPNTPNGGRTMSEQDIAAKGATDKGKRQVGLENVARLWPTPVANDDNKTPEAHLRMKQRMGERDGTHANRTAITSLQVMAGMWWKTPHGMAGTDRNGKRGGAGGGEFAKQANTWASPQSRDYRSAEVSEGVYQANPRPLNEQASRFFCPDQASGKNGRQSSPQRPSAPLPCAVSTGDYLPLDSLVYCRMAWTARRRGWAGSQQRPSLRRKLNPIFSELLMGLPRGWANPAESINCAGSAMESYLCRQRLRLYSLLDEPGL